MTCPASLRIARKVLPFSSYLSLLGWKTAPSSILISFHHLIITLTHKSSLVAFILKIGWPTILLCLGYGTFWAKLVKSWANLNKLFTLFSKTQVYNSVMCDKPFEGLGITKMKWKHTREKNINLEIRYPCSEGPGPLSPYSRFATTQQTLAVLKIQSVFQRWKVW